MDCSFEMIFKNWPLLRNGKKVHEVQLFSNHHCKYKVLPILAVPGVQGVPGELVEPGELVVPGVLVVSGILGVAGVLLVPGARSTRSCRFYFIPLLFLNFAMFHIAKNQKLLLQTQ